MRSTGLDVFDKTLQSTHIWSNKLGDEIGPNDQLAWQALGPVLRAIRDRLPIDLGTHLGSQLPLLVRGSYYDRFRPSELPQQRSLDEFLEETASELEMNRPVNTRKRDPRRVPDSLASCQP